MAARSRLPCKSYSHCYIHRHSNAYSFREQKSTHKHTQLREVNNDGEVRINSIDFLEQNFNSVFEFLIRCVCECGCAFIQFFAHSICQCIRITSMSVAIDKRGLEMLKLYAENLFAYRLEIAEFRHGKGKKRRRRRKKN